MANLIQSTNTTSTINMGTGDTLRVMAGVQVSVANSYGIQITGNGNATIDVAGSVWGTIGLNAGNNGYILQVHVANGGEISGGVAGIGSIASSNIIVNDGTVSGIRAIVCTVGSAFVTNNGWITSTGTEVYAAGVSAVGSSHIQNSGMISSYVTGVAFSFSSGCSLSNTGTIQSSFGGAVTLDEGVDSRCDILNAGLISSLSGHAIDLQGDGISTISNSGTISSVKASAIEVANASVELDNDGKIFTTSNTSAAVHLTIDANIVTNSGKISGGFTAIHFLGQDDLLVNSGTISGKDDVIVLDAASGTETITNLGQIVTAGPGRIAIEAFNGVTVNLTNKGTISGDVYFFSSGNDVYDGTGGYVNGKIVTTNGNDTLIGGDMRDNFQTGSGTMTIDGAGGNDVISMDGYLDMLDQVDGGDGTDTLYLNGSYPSLVLTDDTVVNIEKIKLANNGTYKIASADGTVAAGQTLLIDGTKVLAPYVLSFNGNAETDGRFDIRSGAGSDVLVGGDGNDRMVAGLGNDSLTGGEGIDRMDGGSGHDKFIYKTMADSTSVDHDVVVGFRAGTDTFDFSFAVTGVDAVINSGVLRTGRFDSDLETAVSAAKLAAHHAVVFTASAGNEHGHTFLVVDANAVAGYQDSQDYVIELKTPYTTVLHTADFV